MKDNISIIFAAIIGVFLIVILPLFSILDRQDSMSYNVVLTATTDFVDNIRNNGFIDKESYNNYISALGSTSNTYKVTIEAYKKKLIHDTDEQGNILDDRFVEEKELLNTYDILRQLEESTNSEISSKKGNVVLLDKDDEIYIKVHNTNITAGSIMYRFLSGIENTEVININYGGVINNVNWEVYGKIKSEDQNVPEVLMTVPVNANGKTNIVRAINNSASDYEYLDNIEGEELTIEEEELLATTYYTSLTGRNYAYLYDLSKKENKTIKVAVELKNIYSINVVDKNTGKEKAITLDELEKPGVFDSVKNDILDYIEANGMYYDKKDVSLRTDRNYYFFDITFTGVRMSSLDFISTVASITIRPGLGQDINGVLSLGSQTVEIELKDERAVSSVLISGPYNFKKIIETDLETARITNQQVFVNQYIVFIIQFTGVSKEIDEIIDAIKQNLNIYDVNYEDLEIISPEDFKEEYKKDLNLNTVSVSSMVVKFKYTERNISETNYIELENYWIDNSLDDYTEDEIKQAGGNRGLSGGKSIRYAVLRDDVAPLTPSILLSGTLGENNWYTSNVIVSLDISNIDYIKSSEMNLIVERENLNEIIVGGSGVYRNYIEISGANTTPKTKYINDIELSKDGETTIKAYADDYLENESASPETKVKIDKTKPTKPKINITSGIEGSNGWYKSDVTINITPGKDTTSGVNRTTYSISGANSLNETEGTSYTLTKDGTSVVTVRTYDNAGNYSEEKLEINMDRTNPPDSEIQVVSGSKHNNTWYYTDVELKITVSAGESVSGLGTCKYRVKEKNSTDSSYTDFTEKEKLITISESGEYTVTVITYTKAGNSKTSELNVKIDKEGPNPVNLSLSGTKGDNDWYKSSVNVVFTSKGDNGPSGEENYIRYTLDGSEAEIETESGKSIVLSAEKEHVLTVYSIDKAGNRTKLNKTIKIDKTGPNADFNIAGDKGSNNWYKGDVTISYENESDNLSDVDRESITLSHANIKEDTQGTDVILSLKDNAGNETIKKTTIKIDKINPTNPTIDILEEPTAGGAYGVLLFNKNVNVTITPGEDTNYNKTTFSVKKDDVTIINEQNYVSSYSISQNGYYIIIARTYDDSGRYSEVSKTIYVNKEKPQAIVINSINGENVKGTLTKTITGNDGNLSIAFENYDENCTLKIKLENVNTYEVIEQNYTAINDGQISMIINTKGKYEIKITQTNIFGSTSNNSSGSYYYDYN